VPQIDKLKKQCMGKYDVLYDTACVLSTGVWCSEGVFFRKRGCAHGYIEPLENAFRTVNRRQLYEHTQEVDATMMERVIDFEVCF
jgi:hypothetical protein